MKMQRASGILLHPTSLPCPYGIGDMGPEAYRFIDWLVGAKQKVWQILPLNPTGYGDSPYQCFSAFAGNPLLLSPELLMRDGLLTADDIKDKPDFPAERVDFGSVIPWKRQLIQRAWTRFMESAPGALCESFDAFCQQEAGWLEDYALFIALKEEHSLEMWTTWERPLIRRDKEALGRAREQHAARIDEVKFAQFLFYRQWEALRAYCAEKGIRIVGDLAIYVAHDSADVWANQELFQLDEDGKAEFVGGVPPDYFSATGQLWGNPIYEWQHHAETGYAWWVERLRAAFRMLDIVRLDHFRGFEAYWEIPGGDETAVNGRWVEGPRYAFFDTMRYVFGHDLPIIAENLGVITEEVEDLRRNYELPGMAVFQFSFGENARTSATPPHALTQDTVAYTGTHDNDTILGWWRPGKENRRQRAYIKKYLDDAGRKEFNWTCIRTVMATVADLAVFPLQDLLGLGSEARMNTPGTIGGNWDWRFVDGVLTPELAGRIRELTGIYGREPVSQPEPEHEEQAETGDA